jgi:glycosyltransferase involved in cell wall biosynthesis
MPERFIENAQMDGARNMPSRIKDGPLNIGYLAYPLDDLRPGGIEFYTYHLIKNLIEIDTRNKYFLIHGEDKKLFEGKNVEDIIIKGGGKLTYFSRMLKSFKLGQKVDLVHGPYTGTPFGNFKKVITVHDIIPSIQGWHDRVDQIHFKISTPIMIKMADMLISDSIKTKNDLIEFYGVDEDKIRVVYLGAVLKGSKGAVDPALMKRLGIKGRTILFVSNMKPVKNVETLIRAFGEIADRIPHQLVLVGLKPKYEAPYDMIKKYKLKDRVVFTGHITDEELAALYSNSDLFVLPSHYEGFGITVLEAMGYGVPVISSNAASLPEVVGDAGVLVDPLAHDKISESMLDILNDDNRRDKMVKKGLEWVKQFTWEKTARETLAVYEEVCGRK